MDADNQEMKHEEAWRSAIGEIELSVGRGNFLTFLKGARLVTYEDGQFVVSVANAYAKDWIENRMASQLKTMLSERMGRSVSLKVVVQSQLSANPPATELRAPAPSAHTPRPAPAAIPSTSDGLILRYTFESFVVGSGNRMAHAAAMSVAENPADRYNPLFLYGGSGLGKTHLLHAIGNHARERNMVCRYVTSETFVNELISAIRSQSQDSFREKYRGVDMLLMDDVQFVAGKETTQEEFFHTFNHLHSANRQIVLTSDRPPKSMITLEERLRSRFEWGLMADIAPPDYETRMAILQAKAQQKNANIPMEVIEFVARQIQSNVRELEGALNQLLATADITGRQVSVQFARDTLINLVGKRAHITPSQVVETVAKYFNVSVSEIVSPSRSKELVQPRQIAMYLVRQETDSSLPEIGALLGGRDHTTVIHGVDRVKDRLETEDQLRRDVMSIREMVYQNVPN
ncbi:MAG TPA: chromosomal replication initiator protein DnaA [Thermoflexales bacterium]|nr:chromosomal replication initiator protein DnaA [Thermoflexales bacterium]HRA00758.1 chromosomal replication initiator protein DnaA [Thermoflexales bacterium]